jgi:Tol biopolymer transport system component
MNKELMTVFSVIGLLASSMVAKAADKSLQKHGTREILNFSREQGSLLLLYEQQSGLTPNVISLANRDSIKAIHSDGVPIRRTTGHWAYPSLSRDGKRIAFIRGEPEGASATKIEYLSVFDIQTKETTDVLTWSRGEIYAIAWSPTGSEIAFVSVGKSRELYVLSIGDGNTKLLQGSPSYRQPPSWSKDGSRIVFENNTSRGESEVVVIAWRTDTLNTLSKGRAPAWSPDGEQIAYVHPNGSSILSIRPDGTVKELYSRRSGRIRGPLVWCPEGRRLAFHTEAGSKGYETSLFVHDLQERKTRRVWRISNFELLGWQNAS